MTGLEKTHWVGSFKVTGDSCTRAMARAQARLPWIQGQMTGNDVEP